MKPKILFCGSPVMAALLVTAAFAYVGLVDEEAFKVTSLDAPAGIATSRFRITGEENPARAVFENVSVGIGVNDPAQALDVAGSFKASGFVEIQNQGSDPAAGAAGTQRIYTLADELKYRKGDGGIETIERQANKNAANGYAGLDATSRIDKGQAPSDTVYTDDSQTLTNKTLNSTGGNTIDATKLQTRDVSNLAPTDGQVLKWNATTSKWEPQEDGGGSGGLPSGSWELVGEVVASSATNQLQITGLNGDADVDYMIRVHVVTTGTGGGSVNVGLRVNGDTGSTSYIYSAIQYRGGTLTVGEAQTSFVNLFSVTGDGRHLMANGWFRAKTGTHREFNMISNDSALGTRTTTGEWNETSTNVTSVQAVIPQGGSNMAAGSSLAVWRRKP